MCFHFADGHIGPAFHTFCADLFEIGPLLSYYTEGHESLTTKIKLGKPVWLTAFWLMSKINQVKVFHQESYLNKGEEQTNQDSKWQDRIWVLSVAGQAGIFIAFPVILGFAVGLLLDRQFNTVILFSVLLAMAGFGGGVYLVYRWVQTTVKKHLADRKKED